MAINDGLNSVFRGQEGSGSAYILNPNQAIGVYQAGIADANERKRLEALALQKRQQEIADNNATALGNFKLGDHWGMKAAELQKDYEDLSNYAVKATQEGRNINSDRDFLQRKQQLLTKAAATKDLQLGYDRDAALVGKNPDAYENGLDVLKSYQNASIEDFMKGNFKPQPLKQIYTTADAIKDSGGTIAYTKRNDGTYDTTKVNRSGNVGQAISSLNTPAAKYLVEKAGGDTGAYIGGFPTKTSDGRTYYNTDGKQFEDAVISTLATDPNLPAYLQSKGYDVSNTDAIRKSAFDFAKKQNKAAGKYIKDYADNLENKATTDITRVFAAEQNQRARNAEGRAIESHAHEKGKWADEALAAQPDSIVSNVVTNLATQRTGAGSKPVMRTSTSLSASNVGNAKTPFLPTVVYNPETGQASRNSVPITVSGGQVHIKPVLNFGGAQKILDDESLKKLRAGTYRLNGRNVPRNTDVSYDEILLGEERIAADPNDILSKATVRKVMIPITDQSLDKKFDKQYNRTQMWDQAIKNTSDFETRKEIIKSQIKRQAPNMDAKALDKLAFDTAKQY